MVAGRMRIQPARVAAKGDERLRVQAAVAVGTMHMVVLDAQLGVARCPERTAKSGRCLAAHTAVGRMHGVARPGPLERHSRLPTARRAEDALEGAAASARTANARTANARTASARTATRRPLLLLLLEVLVLRRAARRERGARRTHDLAQRRDLLSHTGEHGVAKRRLLATPQALLCRQLRGGGYDHVLLLLELKQLVQELCIVTVARLRLSESREKIVARVAAARGLAGRPRRGGRVLRLLPQACVPGGEARGRCRAVVLWRRRRL